MGSETAEHEIPGGRAVFQCDSGLPTLSARTCRAGRRILQHVCARWLQVSITERSALSRASCLGPPVREAVAD